MPEETIGRLRDAIVMLDDDKSKELARKGIEENLNPIDMINEGIRPALDMLGERFSAGGLFLPELMLAATAADAAVSILEPEMLKSGASRDKLGKVLMATVKGDIHDIGKNIVSLLMKSAGFDVVDIGVDKTVNEILAAAKEHKVDVIGLSALLTTTMPQINAFVELVQESDVRDQYKIIIGGAPVTQELADTIGADGYGADAGRAVEVIKGLLA